ncbi:MAG TPA: hypothetical protein PKA24_16810, partial [Microthrixaceae bacterium]|nr:hypothetical protein [Microthrixaceae bacterium]
MDDGGQRFINRELSWLEFNERVLNLAVDPATPPLAALTAELLGAELEQLHGRGGLPERVGDDGAAVDRDGG